MDLLSETTNLDPKYWGKSSWIFLNAIALAYKPEKFRDYKIFFSKLGNILPCTSCSNHYNTFLPKLAQGLKSKSNLIDWLLEIRNDINAKTNDKILTPNDVLEEIYSYSQTNPIPNSIPIPTSILNQLMTKNILIAVLLLVIVYLYNDKKIKHIIKKYSKSTKNIEKYIKYYIRYITNITDITKLLQ